MDPPLPPGGLFITDERFMLTRCGVMRWCLLGAYAYGEEVDLFF